MSAVPHAPTLYIFGGLPAAGKSTLARALAEEHGAFYLRIDTIEHALRAAGGRMVGPEGYAIGYAVAADNLALGLSVVADSVNPIELTRAAWRDVAKQAGVAYREIEVRCSDPTEHRRRVECRTADIPGQVLPTWDEVVTRWYEPWSTEPIVIDTAGQSAEESIAALLHALGEAQP